MKDRTMRAFLFPGQGSQFIGMGKDLAEAFPTARLTFQEVDDALSQNLFKLMTEGSETDLNLTENTQPALMAVSMAVMNVLIRDGGFELSKIASCVAGHSLGEYSALTAASALDLPVTAKLLKLRGQSMQQAVPVGVGAMSAILGLDFADVEAVTKEATQKATQEFSKNLICEIANDNSDGQIVVSGHVEAVTIANQLASEKGAKRALLLPVSAPFHCSLMAPAAQKMSYALGDTNISPPEIPVVANVTAQNVTEPHLIRRLLVDQITGMVRWRQSVQRMKEQGINEMIEIGAGKVLSGLVKRIDKDIECQSVGTPEQIEQLITKLK
jgi:[acyl-carrier-protein] S-malonyltransferase